MGQCLSESVPLFGEGPACNRLARDLGCDVERVGESPEGAVPVCNPFGPACNSLALAQRNDSSRVWFLPLALPVRVRVARMRVWLAGLHRLRLRPCAWRAGVHSRHGQCRLRHLRRLHWQRARSNEQCVLAQCICVRPHNHFSNLCRSWYAWKQYIDCNPFRIVTDAKCLLPCEMETRNLMLMDLIPNFDIDD